MPWTIFISSKDGSQLGEFNSIREKIKEKYPQTKFWREPSGKEKMAAIASAHQEIFGKLFGHLPANERGIFEGNGVTLEFYFGSESVLNTLTIEVRGEENPLPILRQLCDAYGWQVRGPNGKIIDLESGVSSEWRDFIKYRVSAIDKIKKQ